MFAHIASILRHLVKMFYAFREPNFLHLELFFSHQFSHLALTFFSHLALTFVHI